MEQKQKIFRLLDKIIGADVFKQHDFSSQAGLISYRLWQEIFPKAPKVIYLPLEELVSEVVVNIVCKDPNHLLHRLFFSKQGWNLIEKHFQGSLGAFSGAHKGSFLFWGIDTKGRRVHLHRDESGIRNPRRSSRQARTLRGRHELGIEWELKPEKISVALKSKQLYPTSLVCFLVLLYYQITALGGFNQVNWLTNIKEKFIGLLLEMGESEIAEQIKSVPTSNFAESNLAFLVRNGKLIKASGLDIFLEEKDLFYRYQDLAGHLTLKESIESELLEIYKVIVPAQERDQSLLGNNSRLNSSLFEKIRLALDG